MTPASADATIIAATVATLGIMLLASATFMILVEVRGRASDPPALPAGDVRSLTTTKAPADVSPDGVAKVIDALGKLGTVQLLAVGGLIALAIAGMLGWRIATPPEDDPTTAPTPAATTTPETNPPG